MGPTLNHPNRKSQNFERKKKKKKDNHTGNAGPDSPCSFAEYGCNDKLFKKWFSAGSGIYGIV